MEENDKMQQRPKPGEIYRHFKNKLYQVVTIAKHSETGEEMVVYQALYGDFSVYVRPLSMFMGEVDQVKYPEVRQKYRFEKVQQKTAAVQADTPALSDMPKAGTKNQESVETAAARSADGDDKSGVNPKLLMILDADTYAEKYSLLAGMRGDMTDRLINDLSVALDIAVDDGPVDRRYEQLKSALATLCKYEVNRLR